MSLGPYLASEVVHGEVPGGHKPQGKAHLSEPGTHQRTWRVMGRPARQKTQTLSMTRRNDRTRHDHAAVPLAVCPFCFFGGVRGGGLPEVDEPSALRWMAAKAEFPCGLPGGGVASALRWMRCGVS